MIQLKEENRGKKCHAGYSEIASVKCVTVVHRVSIPNGAVHTFSRLQLHSCLLVCEGRATNRVGLTLACHLYCGLYARAFPKAAARTALQSHASDRGKRAAAI